MEENIVLRRKLMTLFDFKEADIRTYSPLTLAYLGDAVYELIIRSVVVAKGNRPVNNLHKMSIHYVKAATQAALIESLEPALTPEELAVYKRGRNAKSYTTPKNATIADYRKATGMEAVIGYLYLTDKLERAVELVHMGLHYVNMELDGSGSHSGFRR